MTAQNRAEIEVRQSWSTSSINRSVQQFEQIFENIYEQEFIDLIFEDFKSLITRENFIEAIKPKDMFDHFNVIDEKHQGTATWLFTPAKIREIFAKHIQVDTVRSDAEQN